MGLAEVKQHIIEEAEKKAEDLLQAARANAKKIIADAAATTNVYTEELRQNTERMTVTATRRERAAADFEGKRLILDKKKEVLTQAVHNAQSQLLKFSADKKRGLLEKLLARAKMEIDVAVVGVNKSDSDFIPTKGPTVHIIEISGGLIAETEDGKISVDLSFDTLLDEIKEANIQEFSEVLFNG